MMYTLLLDEDIHKSAAEQLRIRGYDVVHVMELERTGLNDEEQLLFASNTGRIIVSFNAKDYYQLHNKFLLDKKHHAGIILSKQIPIGEFIKKLVALLHELDSDSIRDNLYFL